jgi:hypothetical protein
MSEVKVACKKHFTQNDFLLYSFFSFSNTLLAEPA